MKLKLKDLGTITTGFTPSKKDNGAWGEDVPFLTPSDYGSGRFAKTSRSLSNEWISQRKNKIVKSPSISVTCIGSDMGRTVFNKKNIVTNQQINSISSIKTRIVSPLYLYYLLQSKRKFLHFLGSGNGSTMPILNKSNFSNIEVELPDLAKQKQISSILNILDKKIELNQSINDNLTNQLNSMFDKMYYESSSRIELMNFISEMKSGDWGKAKLTANFIKPAVIIRGTDFCNVANGQKSDAPIRYLKTATIQKKHLIANDVLIEISGGSPTQSTGRSLLITDKLLNRYNTPVLGTNFTRLFRCETEENAVLFHSYINFLYNKNVFFNYENGTTGIKNLDYKSILKINVNDVQKHSLFPKYFSMYHFYESMKQHLGDESTVLTCLKEQLLRKFF